jgi:NADPH-dependent 2,4-dienoyl-CoA reductase/sulfur reductase-like enzyme
VAGHNAIGGQWAFVGSLGTQAVRAFDQVAAATGLRDTQATQAGFRPITVEAVAGDREAYYYPGATP